MMMQHHPMHRFDDTLLADRHQQPMAEAVPAHEAARWSPYQDNGGTALAIASDDFAMFAADTRLSRGYSILSRNVSKYRQLTKTACIVTCGMRADIDALQKTMAVGVTKYVFEHRREPSINALAQLLSVTLYQRRFFPFYTFNMLVGLNSEGKGVVYSYDAVGNTEPLSYGATGSGSSMILSVLDARLSAWNQQIKPAKATESDIVDLAKNALNAAAERDIKTGDAVDLVIISKDGVKVETSSLRND